MSQETREKLEQIAESYDCFYGGKPWIAGLLEKIGTGQLEVVPSPPYRGSSSNRADIRPVQRIQNNQLDSN